MDAHTLPVLTEVIQAPKPQVAVEDAQARIVAQLPDLVQATIEALRPQLEQALMDALLPRVMAMLEHDGQSEKTT